MPKPALIAALAGLTLALAGCDTLSKFNPFDTSEKYEMRIVPDTPATALYDDGLGRMRRGDHEGVQCRHERSDRSEYDDPPQPCVVQHRLLLEVMRHA